PCLTGQEVVRCPCRCMAVEVVPSALPAAPLSSPRDPLQLHFRVNVPALRAERQRADRSSRRGPPPSPGLRSWIERRCRPRSGLLEPPARFERTSPAQLLLSQRGSSAGKRRLI